MPEGSISKKLLSFRIQRLTANIFPGGKLQQPGGATRENSPTSFSAAKRDRSGGLAPPHRRD